MDEEKWIQLFSEHVSKYDLNCEQILLKKEHSLRVMKLAKQLACECNLSEEEIKICTLAGLLHDYSRFEQWTKFNTFCDYDSFDHGDRAAQILFDEQEIKKFNVDEKYYDTLRLSIKYHNKFEVACDIQGKNRLFCNIIRDSDKIDIFYILGTNKNYFYSDGGKISSKNIENFMNYKLLNLKYVNNRSEKVLANLACVFDINFNWSLRKIIADSSLQNMYEFIEDKNTFYKYFKCVLDYIKKRLCNEGHNMSR